MKTQKQIAPQRAAQARAPKTGGPLQRAADSSAASQSLTELQLMADARPTVQRAEDDEVQAKFIQRAEAPAPKKNNTGLPDNLKSGIENLSGMSMDHVRVHRNSDKPATVQAHAYAQGSNIHLAPGQEKHLPHEAWHVVQQAQGRVKPTMQMKGVAVNDDPGLEHEADVMGAKALQMKTQNSAPAHFSIQTTADGSQSALQCVLIENTAENRARDAELTGWYHDAENDARATLLENGGNWTADILERAIGYWTEAADYREQAGALHVEQDDGHLRAIAFCENQIDFLSGLLSSRR